MQSSLQQGYSTTNTAACSSNTMLWIQQQPAKGRILLVCTCQVKFTKLTSASFAHQQALVQTIAQLEHHQCSGDIHAGCGAIKALHGAKFPVVSMKA